MLSNRTVQGAPVKREEGMAHSTKLLIVACVILVGGLSIVAGAMLPAFFHPLQNNTFSNSGLSFQYPGNWSNNVSITWISDNDLQNETIGTLGNGNVTLGVLYEPASSDDIQSLGDITVDSWKGNGASGELLSNTLGQVGANSVYEIIYTEKDPATNVMYENYYVMLGGSGNHVYAMRFRAPQADFANYYPQFQSIVSSVIITNQTQSNTPTTTQVINPTESVNVNNVMISPQQANQIIISSGVPPNLTLTAQLDGDSYEIIACDANGNFAGYAIVNAQTGAILNNNI